MSRFELLNSGSFVLGIIAWLIPIVHIFMQKKISNKTSMWLFIASFTACAFSLYFQIMQMEDLVGFTDYILKGYRPLMFIVSVLIFVTIILNSVVIVLNRRSNKK